MSITVARSIITVIGVSLLLCACESDLRLAGGAYLEPMSSQGEYRWRTFADAVYPIDSKKAEAARLRQLDTTLRLNGACPNGYIVAHRQSTLRVAGAVGSAYDIFYTVRCK